MMRRVVVVACLAGCFSKPPPPNGRPDGGGSGSDGSISIDAPIDAGMCASWRAFGPAEQVSGLAVPNVTEPTLSQSGVDMIYRNGSVQLVEAIRAHVGDAFGSSIPVNGLVGSDLSAAWLAPNR